MASNDLLPKFYNGTIQNLLNDKRTHEILVNVDEIFK